LLPRDVLATHKTVKPSLPAHVARSEEQTIVGHLLARKVEAESSGLGWPTNLRVEKKLEKSAWRGVSRHIVRDLKKVMKER
jgi:hypothetical protein